MITLMVGVSEWVEEPEIIFPEMAALTIGTWVVDKRVWHCNKWKMVFSMSLCAFLGILIVKYAPFSLLVNIGIAFSLAATHLICSRTTLIPQISAIILPVLLETDSWVYPISVFIMSLILVFIQSLMEKRSLRQKVEYVPIKQPLQPLLFSWFFLLTTTLLIATLAIYTQNIYLILPPLIVTYIEFAHSKAGFRNRPLQIIGILFMAISLGSLFQWYGYFQWHLPKFIIAFFLMSLLFVLFEYLGKFFAPAGAVALIPLLLPQETLLWLPLQVFIGSVLFIGIAMLCFQKCYTWPSSQLILCFIPSFIRNLRKRNPKN